MDYSDREIIINFTVTDFTHNYRRNCKEWCPTGSPKNNYKYQPRECRNLWRPLKG